MSGEYGRDQADIRTSQLLQNRCLLLRVQKLQNLRLVVPGNGFTVVPIHHL